MIIPRVPLQHIHSELLERHELQLFMLRTDLNHSEISGNKLYKLKYNLEKARQQNMQTLLTFGGAYSNHIAATAAAGREEGFQTIGIIRGEKVMNPTLKLAERNGMQLFFVSRGLYRNKAALNDFVQSKFAEKQVYIIPEGGANPEGVMGCREILQQLNIPFNTVCCPCGTGTTLAGIILSLKKEQQAIGFQALKAPGYIREETEKMLNHFDHPPYKNWHVEEDFHFGGYAKIDEELRKFCRSFEQEHGIPLDYVYTGKMMFGIFRLIEKGYFRKGETIIAVHTGGIQGNAGFDPKESN